MASYCENPDYLKKVLIQRSKGERELVIKRQLEYVDKIDMSLAAVADSEDYIKTIRLSKKGSSLLDNTEYGYNSLVDRAKLSVRRSQIINKLQLGRFHSQASKLFSGSQSKFSSINTIQMDNLSSIHYTIDSNVNIKGKSNNHSSKSKIQTPFMKSFVAKNKERSLLINKIIERNNISQIIQNDLNNSYYNAENSNISSSLLSHMDDNRFPQQKSSDYGSIDNKKYSQVIKSIRDSIKDQQNEKHIMHKSMKNVLIQNCKKLRVIEKSNKHNFSNSVSTKRCESFKTYEVKGIYQLPLPVEHLEHNHNHASFSKSSTVRESNKPPHSQSTSATNLNISMLSQKEDKFKLKIQKSSIGNMKSNILGKYGKAIKKAVIKSFIPITQN